MLSYIKDIYVWSVPGLKLSIIIPTYNVEDYLAKCLDSVICPDLKNYEIIIVNDGSTDRSLLIAEEYCAKYPELIRIISQENGGLGAARNTGIEAAAGDYLLFLDSDDYLAEGALNEILETIEQDYDIFIFDFLQVNIYGQPVGNIYGSDKLGELDLQSHPELLFQAPAACNKLIRRSLFIESGIRFPGHVWFEDLRTIPKLYLYTDKILALRKPWYMYVIRRGSITNSRNTVRNVEIIDAVDEIINFYRSKGKYDSLKNELEYLAFYNQYLTSCTRVNLSQWNSPIQRQLMDDYCKKYSPLNENPYIRSMPFKHRLLTFLLRHRMFLSVHIIMKLNSLIKNK